MIIAVDGPAASGKGTIAKALARHYGLPHLDTGLLYRAVALTVQRMELDPAIEADAVAACNFDEGLLDDPALRQDAIGQLASICSAHPLVRAALLQRQKRFARQPGGAVLDGRDIGTVICPDADVKIYVVADPAVRARRRTLEAKGRGEAADEALVLADILKRDERDQNRPVAPLKPAEDAYLLDNSNLDIEGGVRAAIDIVEAVRAGRQRV